MSEGVLRRLAHLTVRFAPLLLFLAILLVFSSLSNRFLDVRNMVNILIQSAHVGILGIGMTFVLLTAGIDLSVGAVMYVCAAILGVYLTGLPVGLAVLMVLCVGTLFGAVNAVLVTRLAVAPFIATLGTMFMGRGLALYVTETQIITLPKPILELGRTAPLGISWAVWAFAAVLVLSWLVLARTSFGRHVYAVGADAKAALKAGINVPLVLFSVYVICGFLAAVAGLVSASQVGTISPTFAVQKEFAAVAAAVLGGTSLFGGRGSVLGTVFGAILIQTVENGLVIVNADPYIYPIVIATIIFAAVLLDSLRSNFLDRINQRAIRIEGQDP